MSSSSRSTFNLLSHLLAQKKCTVHLVGVKGVAMTALAQILSDLGAIVTGSDMKTDFVTKEILKQNGYTIYPNFAASNITDQLDAVIYTGAHNGSQNIEVQRANVKGIPTLSHAEALGQLMGAKKGISVCGAGGKSTTSAMIAWILAYAKKDPSYAVGVGNIPNLHRTGRYSDGEWFVAEADEFAIDPTCDFRPRFIFQHPEVIVCPNLNYDHPDVYPTFEKMQQTFYDFFHSNHAYLVLNGDSDVLFNLCKDSHLTPSRWFVGKHERNHFQISEITVAEKKSSCVLKFIFEGSHPFWESHKELQVELMVPGEHNLFNACYAIIASASCGVEPSIAIEALRKFKGTMRRFEFIGNYQGSACYDDYAHTPNEIRVTLEALRKWCPNKKVILAFQPHTFSRTRALFDSFAIELGKADEVILLDIFPSAREEFDPRVSSHSLSDHIRHIYPDRRVTVVANTNMLVSLINRLLTKDSVFMTIGAGDIYEVYKHIPLIRSDDYDA